MSEAAPLRSKMPILVEKLEPKPITPLPTALENPPVEGPITKPPEKSAEADIINGVRIGKVQVQQLCG